jgi:hypothetical protein
MLKDLGETHYRELLGTVQRLTASLNHFWTRNANEL